MSTPLRLGAFAVALLAVHGGGVVAGKAFSPDDSAPRPQAAPQADLEVLDEPVAGRQQLQFLLENDGEPLSEGDLAVVHEKRLHVIAVRDDLTGFQHVHPREVDPADQVWAAPLDLGPGRWRLYADFQETGLPASLAQADLTVPGTPSVRSHGPWEDGTTRRVDGYTVALPGELEVGGMTMLTPRITRAGRPVTPEPYLGAQGHLVVIRHETLDYLHVHPEGDTFHVEVGKPGTYELFLQFKHGGRVHTAQFTMKAHGTTEEEGGHDHGH